MTYTTIMGDTWDGIAYKVYGKGAHMTTLMLANQEYLELVVFSAGTILKVPELKNDSTSALPPWKR
ncbi:tail protein X [Paenibacillus sp. NRS-1760]|uniref:tail protein X n=1 Tax=Paenibacillus sp. NRS-1760 TaxID=3233902 RepID=UPI003D2C2742